MFQKLSSIKFPAKNLHLITVTIPWSCFSLLVEKSSIEMTISVRAGGRSGSSSRSLACAKKCWEKDSDENTGNLERENHNQSLFQVKMETGISGLFENIKGWNCNFWDQSGFLIFLPKDRTETKLRSWFILVLVWFMIILSVPNNLEKCLLPTPHFLASIE